MIPTIEKYRVVTIIYREIESILDDLEREYADSPESVKPALGGNLGQGDQDSRDEVVANCAQIRVLLCILNNLGIEDDFRLEEFESYAKRWGKITTTHGKT